MENFGTVNEFVDMRVKSAIDKANKTHTDKRRDKARIIANDNGISVRQAYRRLRNVEVSAENEDFDYEAETPKGEWV